MGEMVDINDELVRSVVTVDDGGTIPHSWYGGWVTAEICVMAFQYRSLQRQRFQQCGLKRRESPGNGVIG
jgi:hypothetical protein